jgi:hypothetical protein
MSDISAKRAEEVAYNLQLSGISGSTWSATEVEASNMLRALAAENEKLRAALREIRNKARTGRPPFMSSKTDFFQIASKALGEKG